MDNAVLEDVRQTGRSDLNSDRNVEQQFRFSIYFRAKFFFCSQLSLQKRLDSVGCCVGVAYLDENWSRFLVIRHVAKLDFNPPLRPMNV